MDAGAWQLKFVVARPEDVEEIEGMLAQLRCDVPRHKVLLMPEGTTIEALRSRAPWLGELCKQRGFRYAHRLQIELYGNIRGT
jgi:7-carboxy-7-deazaguanine synthase